MGKTEERVTRAASVGAAHFDELDAFDVIAGGDAALFAGILTHDVDHRLRDIGEHGLGLQADVNGDGVIDIADLDLIRKHGRMYDITLDVNLDGKIDNEDLNAVRERVGR